MLEKNFKLIVQRDLKKLPNIWVLKTNERGRAGVPDLIVCWEGNFIAIELKRSQSVLATQLQLEVISRIRAAGGLGFVATPEQWPGQLEAMKLMLGEANKK